MKKSNMIQDPLKILRGVLELEQKKGFSDKAVVGGIDAFWNQQKDRIQGTIKDPSLLQSFRSMDKKDFSYKALDINARQKWISSLLELTGRIGDSAPSAINQRPTDAESACPDSRSYGNERVKTTNQKPIVPMPQQSPAKKSGIIDDRSNLSLNSPLINLKGVGPSLVKKFIKLGLEKIRDLVYFFPRRHIDYSQLKPISYLETGKEQTIMGIIWEAKETVMGRRKGTEAIVGDETGNIRVVWFNQPYLSRRLKTNERIVLSGRVNLFKGRRQMEAPQWDLLSEGDAINTARLVPVYSLTEGLYQRTVRNIISGVVRQYSGLVPEFLPADMRHRQKLMDLSEALMQAHLPDSLELKDRSRQRLAFDELLLFQLGVLGRRYSWQEANTSPVLKIEKDLLDKFLLSTGFQLTQAQIRALAEILKDMDSARPMCRMLQGDVGSGKTILAAAALLAAACSGRQAIMMAPTEILAEQHFQTLGKLFGVSGEAAVISEHIKSAGSWNASSAGGLTIALLTGSMSRKEKMKVYEMAKEGQLDIIVGTHALIQEGLSLKNLGLAIIDEQHRFGVEQRSSLRQKGFNPHLLVMTATPIPRTLALTFFGDLDLSVLDQMPPGRKPVKTKRLNPEERDKAYAFIQKKIAEGQQAYIICPRIEESDNIDAEGQRLDQEGDSDRREIRAAIAEYERLSSDVFPEIRLGLLHGKMPAVEKEAVMRSFKRGEVKILVSTSVVEVGIDVPKATVMLVEGAENFGLSQLHQFRGRIGRGTEQSYCVLLSDSTSPEAHERLSLIERVYDGFVLAEEDLKMRGPGEFFGTRQSGMPDLTMAKLSDAALLDKARQEAIEIYKVDPKLTSQVHKLLSQRVKELWKVEGELS